MLLKVKSFSSIIKAHNRFTIKVTFDIIKKSEKGTLAGLSAGSRNLVCFYFYVTCKRSRSRFGGEQ